MFQGASNIKIVGSTFNAYGSGGTDDKQRIVEEMALLNEKKRIAEAMAMALLESRAEKGAPYDAAAREDVPKCHEHTRVAIIDGVHNWAHSQDPDAPPLMWLYGPAGCGKTTIVQTVAETFDKEKTLAASFFFSKSSPARPKSKENFVTTLAHQLSLHIPALQKPMADALYDSSLLSKSLVKQLDTLIIEPLNKLDVAEMGQRFIFLVDGLDECHGDAAQRDTLILLERLLDQTRARLRIRILVASRVLSHVQAFFSQRRIGMITQTTPLDNNYQSNEDITEYFRAEFARILSEHPSQVGLPCDWPPASDVKILVRRASGQFIYAAVAMKFIASHDRHPGEALKTIIGLQTTDVARPYEDLDAVYHHVLSTVEPENLEFVQTLMGCLLVDNRLGELYAPEILQQGHLNHIDSFFMLEPGATVARFNRMSPLIDMTPQWRFSHASFAEYLQDSYRSKEFFLDNRKAHCLLARHWFRSFSIHFKNHPGKGVIPTGLPFYFIRHGDHSESGYSSPEDGLLYDVIFHCMKAEWTSGLQQDVLQFDVHAAFRNRSAVTGGDKRILSWEGIVRWLNFILWVKEKNLLSLAETINIFNVIEDMIRSTFLELPIPANILRASAALLMLRNQLDIRQFVAWYKELDSWGLLWTDLLLCRKHLPDACLPWLYRAIGVDIEISTAGNICTDLALLYAHNPFKSDKSNWPLSIAPMLSNASPSEELAALLMKDFLQVHKNLLQSGHERSVVEPHFTAIIIYLFECGVPFLSGHQHGPDFDPINWICGICLLLDPHKVECADIELSREPTTQLASLHAQIAPGEVAAPAQPKINGLRHIIPGLPLLWLQAWFTWFAWFADIMTRFFPVVA